MNAENWVIYDIFCPGDDCSDLKCCKPNPNPNSKPNLYSTLNQNLTDNPHSDALVIPSFKRATQGKFREMEWNMATRYVGLYLTIIIAGFTWRLLVEGYQVQPLTATSYIP